MFYSYFEREYEKVLTFNIVRFASFKISASFLLAPPSNRHRSKQFQNLINAGGAYYKKYGIPSFIKFVKLRNFLNKKLEKIDSNINI